MEVGASVAVDGRAAMLAMDNEDGTWNVECAHPRPATPLSGAAVARRAVHAAAAGCRFDAGDEADVPATNIALRAAAAAVETFVGGGLGTSRCSPLP